MKIIEKIKYIYSKCILYMQIPSIRGSNINEKARVGHRSNIIDVSMGKYSYCGNSCTIVNTSIGNYCSIASYCSIGGGVHPQYEISTSPVFYEKNNAFGVCFQPSHENIFEERTIIKNDVWIGEKCFIKQGVTIGNGAIVGAHSVVTKDIPDFAVVAGVPARIIKYRFNNNSVAILQESKWWDWSEEKLRSSDFLLLGKQVSENQKSDS